MRGTAGDIILFSCSASSRAFPAVPVRRPMRKLMDAFLAEGAADRKPLQAECVNTAILSEYLYTSMHETPTIVTAFDGFSCTISLLGWFALAQQPKGFNLCVRFIFQEVASALG